MLTKTIVPILCILALLLAPMLPGVGRAAAQRAAVHASYALLQVLPGRFADSSSELLDNIEGLNAADIQSVVDETNPYEELGGLLGDTLFPSEDQDTLDIKYLKGAGGGAVMASITDHNAESPIVDRKGLEKVTGEIPSIKQKLTQDAETLIRLQEGSATQVARAVQSIYDDVNATRRGVRARLEWIRMQVLATSLVTYSEDGVKLNLDYLVPAGHKATLAGTALWSDYANSDPIGDLTGWQDTMVADRGIQMERAITRRQVVSAVLRNEALRKAIYGVNYDRMPVLEEVNEFLQRQGLPMFVTYDLRAQVIAANGARTATPFFPDGRLVMLPALASGAPGKTRRAPTAEEAVRSIAKGVTAVDGNRIATRVYLGTDDPVNMVTRAVASAFPSFERADDVFQAKVL